MQGRSHRRQLWLFLLAIAVPSTALVWIGARLIVQETELEESRQLAERRRIVNQTSQELGARFERIKLQEVAALAATGFSPPVRYSDSAVVLVGLVRENSLVLPWELAPDERGVRNSANASFDDALRRAEDAEFGADDVGSARTIIQEYGDLSIGLADASLIVLSRRLRTNAILTLDERHFRVLRGFSNKPFRILPADA